MQDQPDQTGPAPMEGHGGYNARSSVQASGAAPALPLLDEAARTVALPAGSGPVTVADYGASQGHNSLAPMAVAVRTLRDRLAAGREISVVHTDLADNDFSALFDLLESDPASYLNLYPDVFASAVGRSFYRQILPTGSVTLGWSAWSVQWLSRIPAPIPDQLQISYSRSPDARAAYAAQAAQDWTDFLRHRGRELHDGAQLVVITMARTDAGDFGYAAQVEAIYDTLQALVAEGRVQKEEAARMAIPTYGRTRQEFAAPFAAGPFAGLRLDRLEIFEGDDAIWRDFQKNGDAASFGARWSAFSRGSVLPTMALGLAGAGPERMRDFIDLMEAGMTRRLAAAPAPTLMPLAAIVLSAVAGTGPARG